jgi:hypothetical protein
MIHARFSHIHWDRGRFEAVPYGTSEDSGDTLPIHGVAGRGRPMFPSSEEIHDDAARFPQDLKRYRWQAARRPS